MPALAITASPAVSVRTLLLGIVICFLAGACNARPTDLSLAPTGHGTTALGAGQQPDIIMILVDDLDARLLPHLTGLQASLAAQGMTFENFFTPQSVCCPSRATILTGLYSHNHNVLEVSNGPIEDRATSNSGWWGFQNAGHEADNLARWLDALGYETAMIGKYLNGYGQPWDPETTFVPPYWDAWRACIAYTYDYLGTTYNMDGVRQTSAADAYQTDQLRDFSTTIIAQTPSETPLFLYINPVAPHSAGAQDVPPIPAPRHSSEFAGVQMPPKPSFNEADVSDKTAWLRSLPLLTQPEIDAMNDYFRKSLQSMRAVEELVDAVVTALDTAGRLDRAYIFFASDNGFHQGEHRMTYGKRMLYEEDVRIPMFVRGPGVPVGSVREHLVMNVDLAQTFIELAGGNAPLHVDGRSLLPLMRPGALPEDAWRRRIGLERPKCYNGAPYPTAYGVRTATHTYIVDGNAEQQLYDLAADPFQLESLHGEASQLPLSQELADWTGHLSTCTGRACRAYDSRAYEPRPRRLNALFRPCIATTSACATTLVWDARTIDNGFLRVVAPDDSTLACATMGTLNWADSELRDWKTGTELRVYDATRCDGDPASAGPLLETLLVAGSIEASPIATGQMAAFPNPCWADGGGCASTVVWKTAGIDATDWPSVQLRTHDDTWWACGDVNTTDSKETGAWISAPLGVEMSLYPAASCAGDAVRGPRLATLNIFKATSAPPQHNDGGPPSDGSPSPDGGPAGADPQMGGDSIVDAGDPGGDIEPNYGDSSSTVGDTQVTAGDTTSATGDPIAGFGDRAGGDRHVSTDQDPASAERGTLSSGCGCAQTTDLSTLGLLAFVAFRRRVRRCSSIEA